MAVRMQLCFSLLLPFLCFMLTKAMASPSTNTKTRLKSGVLVSPSIGNSSSLVYVKFSECCGEYPAACEDRDAFERIRNTLNSKLRKINKMWRKVQKSLRKTETTALRWSKRRNKIRNLEKMRRQSMRSSKAKSFLKLKRKEGKQGKWLKTNMTSQEERKLTSIRCQQQEILRKRKTVDETLTLATDMYNDIATVGQECTQLRDLAKESVVRIKDSEKLAEGMIKAIHNLLQKISRIVKI